MYDLSYVGCDTAQSAVTEDIITHRATWRDSSYGMRTERCRYYWCANPTGQLSRSSNYSDDM